MFRRLIRLFVAWNMVIGIIAVMGFRVSLLTSSPRRRELSISTTAAAMKAKRIESVNDHKLQKSFALLSLSGDNNNGGEDSRNDDENNEIIIVNKPEDVPDALWDDIQKNQPSKFEVAKEVLGINIFTYILAAAIVLFLSLNFLLGPGWLGSLMGVSGTGTINEVSKSLPETMDLSGSEYLLQN